MSISIGQSSPVQNKVQSNNDMSKIAQNKVNGLNRQLESLGNSEEPNSTDQRRAIESQISFIESKMKNMEKGRTLDLYV